MPYFSSQARREAAPQKMSFAPKPQVPRRGLLVDCQRPYKKRTEMGNMIRTRFYA